MKSNAYVNDLMKKSPADLEQALVVIKENDANTVLSARNIPNANTALADNLNVYDIMKAGKLVLAKDAAEKIQEVYA